MTFTRNPDGTINLVLTKAECHYLAAAVACASGEWGSDAEDKAACGVLQRAENEALA